MVASNDFLEEKHEMETICMAFYRRRLARAYNQKVRHRMINIVDLVL